MTPKRKGKGWRENPDASGKAPRHQAVQTRKKLSGTSRTPMKSKSPYSHYNLTERRIAEMLTENTGINMLDSGGASGRGWQRNQGKDFKSEPAVEYKVERDGFVLIEFNVFHYLKTYAEITQTCEKLQSKFMKFARSPQQELKPWLVSMEWFADTIDEKSNRENFLRGTTNTYNYDNILSQILQYVGFSYQGKTYLLLQIHNGADARGGYTAPQVFEVKDEEYFLMAQNNVYADDDHDHKWSSDDGGNHWQSDGEESGELVLEERNGKAHHKGCGAEVTFRVMDSY